MANTQNWTNFQGGCLTTNIGQAACLGGWTFTNFVMGLNSNVPSTPSYPVIAPAGSVLITSNCCGYYLQLLQNFLCRCDATNCFTQTPTTEDSPSGGADNAAIKATISALTGSPIFGLAFLSTIHPSITDVSGAGVIIDTTDNTINIATWSNQSLCVVGTVLASAPYTPSPSDTISMNIVFGSTVQALVNDTPLASTDIANITLSDFAGIVGLTSTGTVTLTSVDTSLGRLCL